MARRRPEEQKAEVPMSSMIDIVFLLLIYFIVTQKPIIEDTHLGVDLPTPGGKPKDKPITLFTIDVHKQSDDPGKDLDIYYVNGRKWNFNDLALQLKKTAEQDKEQTIILNCGPNARHQKLIRILDACHDAGLSKLNLVNDESIEFQRN